MRLAQLRADNFRLIQNLSLQPHRRLNFILGPNAAGKTSLLEAIYVLGRGKSFRGHSPAELAGAHGRRWGTAGQVIAGDRPGEDVSVRWTPAGIVASLAAQGDVAVLELVRALPIQILEPGMHRLLQDGPSYRRSFLDWGVFHVEHDFYPTWRRFHRALRQRNQALRTGGESAAIRAWEGELVDSSLRIQALRQAHLDAIRQRFGILVRDLLGISDWTLDLHPGWSREHGYAESLTAQLARDRRMGTTVEGAHRAELRIRLDAHNARNRVSRGQQKLLVAALLIAQAELIRTQRGVAPLLLVDDFGAELATEFQRRFLGALQSYPGQLFITSFELGDGLASVRDAALFHVEQGTVTAA
jgi:DNA replication and repair protein RecF